MVVNDSFTKPHADDASPLRGLILSQFEPAIASQLIEFGKFLSTLDADVLIFMARKSLCLYDLLVAIGTPPSERVVLSDRALDLDTDSLKGKRLALIDDTLIVGTTLAKTRDFLATIPDCTVSIHVFCVDITWHQETVLKPDTIFLRADDRTVMTFCAALVRAMSLLPRPYLVDFPMSKPFRVRLGDIQCLLSSTSWRSFRLSSTLQLQNGVEAYTFLPSSECLNEFLGSIHSNLRSLVDITKIRAFGRYHDDVLWTRLVPIVTVAPLTSTNLRSLLATMLCQLPGDADAQRLTCALNSPQAQHRFIQFLLGIRLGNLFCEHLHLSIGSSLKIELDEVDIERHYGPWLTEPVVNCISSLDRVLSSPHPEENAAGFEPARIPNLVGALANEVVRSAELACPVFCTSERVSVAQRG